MDSVTLLQHIRQAGRGSFRDLEAALTALAARRSPVSVPAYTVATLPDAAEFENHLVICTDGASGSPILAFSDGSDWLRSDDSTPVDDGS